MGKQNKRKNNQRNFGGGGKQDWLKNKRQNQQKDPNDGGNEKNYALTQIKLGSPYFDEYYKEMFKSCITTSEEFDLFKNTLVEKLPVTFRVNPGNIHNSEIIKLFQDKQFFEKYAVEGEKQDGKEQISMHQNDHQGGDVTKKMQLDFSALKMDCKEWYPRELVYELLMPANLLKKVEGLKQIHKMIDASKDSGLISRQEITSMLPPLVCDIKSEHSVFDMCAAPGSKTAQCLELIMSDHLDKANNQSLPKGFVLANDADHKRAYLLTHQMNRFNTANVCVSNHNAQDFPNLYFQPQQTGGELKDDARFMFDRVLCDVPCSSDAAIRKLPTKWATWSPKESQSLHPLQIKIVQRGFEVLKVGGKLSFSTCSLNPIEDEAVVAAILKQYGDKIKILDVKIPGFKIQEGLTSWKFMHMKSHEECEEIQASEEKVSFFNTYESFEDVPEDVKFKNKSNKVIRETMFENYYSDEIKQELKKCLRVMPHHQNTSGFFITIFEKLKEFDTKGTGHPLQPKLEPDHKDKVLPLDIQQVSERKAFRFLRCDPADADIYYIRAYFGIKESFPFKQLITQDPSFRKIYFISNEVSEFLYTDAFKNHLNIINIGVQLFQRNNSKFGGTECIFRIVQDGVLNLIPYMTKRIIRTTDLSIFKKCISKRYNGSYSIFGDDKETAEELDSYSPGCFVLVLTGLDGKNIEALTMHKFENALSTMICRENIQSLQMRFLSKEERVGATQILLAEDKNELREVSSVEAQWKLANLKRDDK